MSTKPLAAAVLAALACAAQAETATVQQPPAGPPVVHIVRAPAAPSTEMQRLMASAHELRASIAALANKPAGTERDVAIAKAQEALRKTRQAMADLPPEYRTASATPAPQRGYDASVRTLMHAADALRQSIHAMAHEPAGPRRNQAIRDANRALMDTQVAMANAYDATAFAPPQTATLGAGPMQCAWLGSMWGCR